MKTVFFSAIFAMATAVPAFSQNVTVQTDPSATMDQQYYGRMNYGSPNFGGPNFGTQPMYPGDPMSAWCNNALRVLDQARMRARMAYAYGDYAVTKQHLVTGLTQAGSNSSQFRSTGPITARAIQRGITLATAIDSASAGDPSGARTVVYFLFKYYDFIARVARDLDLPFYIPYQNCGMCGDFNETLFEQKFTEFAKEQLSNVLYTLAENTGYRVTPIGVPRAFLTALAMTAGATAQDLRSSLWSRRYACEIIQLEQLCARINAYLSGSRFEYPSEFEAVNAAFREAEWIVQRIGTVGAGCFH